MIFLDTKWSPSSYYYLNIGLSRPLILPMNASLSASASSWCYILYLKVSADQFIGHNYLHVIISSQKALQLHMIPRGLSSPTSPPNYICKTERS